MCLHRSTYMQVAKKDITCYKLIQIYHFPGGDDYRSYFQNTKIELNKPITAFIDCDADILNRKSWLYGEVVHAYSNIYCDDSCIDWYIQDTRECPHFRECDVSIAKVMCIIPKGTIFCEGVDDDDNPCYGALEIIPKRVIETISTIHRNHE